VTTTAYSVLKRVRRRSIDDDIFNSSSRRYFASRNATKRGKLSLLPAASAG